MAIIDPDGLYNGDRLRQCSDMARLHWPYLFLAANGYGRFEVNYRRISAAVYVDFHLPPTEEEFYGFINEYRSRHLLFLYQAGSQVWGQWYCKPGSLPRYHTARDNASPAPPIGAFESWINSYKAQTKPLPKFSEIFQNLPKTSGKFPYGVGVGVGEGVGEGEGEDKQTPPEIGGAFTLVPPNGVSPPGWATRKFEEFWAVVWTKVGKDVALKAFKRKAGNVDEAERIIEAAKAHGPRLLKEAHDQQRSVLHPATWLNQGRYLDEPAGEEPSYLPPLANGRGPLD